MGNKSIESRTVKLCEINEIYEKPAYGIIDPDYARIFTIARCVAWSYGYALAMHGSFTRDLDLIAVPWTPEACPQEHLIHQIAWRANLTSKGEPSIKPHGRLAYSLHLSGENECRWVDISVMPQLAVAQEGIE